MSAQKPTPAKKDDKSIKLTSEYSDTIHDSIRGDVEKQLGNVGITWSDWLFKLGDLEIPAILDWDDKLNRLVCKDPAIIRLLQLATNGEPLQLRRFFHRPGRLRTSILKDNDGRIRMALLANALKRAEEGDLAWSKHALQIIDHVNRQSKPTVETNKKVQAVRAKKRAQVKENRKKYVLERLLGADEESEEVPEGEGQGGVEEGA